MIKKIIITIAAIALLLVAGFKIFKLKRAYQDDLLQIVASQQLLGIYDTTSGKLEKAGDNTLHYLLQWTNNKPTALPSKTLISLFSKAAPLFINLQIYPENVLKPYEDNIAAVVARGEYDLKLAAFFKLLAQDKNPVYLRYNGDMEVPSYQYPWQSLSFTQYINSFRHISTLLKKYAPAVKMIFGPAGYPGAEEYWPGDEYVDLVSLNMITGNEFAKDPYPAYKSSAEMIRRKLFRMRFMQKPILLLSTESLKGPLQQEWLDEVNNKIAADKPIYNTPVVPAEHDTIRLKLEDRPAIQVGLYDPGLLLTNQPAVTIEHVFTDMISIMNGSFKLHFDSIVARHHNVIVTVEPWKYNLKKRDTAVLEHTLSGVYDNVWTALYQQISNVPQTVYLRWAHEMEIPIERYEWQSKDPVTYIKAFRYVANFQKPRASNIKMVWGPAGDRGSMEWWPGGDVVDFVSVAVYGIPDKNINDYNKQNSFSSIFRLKFFRMRFTNKPIFVTEFGVKGPEAYQKKWLEDAADVINQFPEIYGVNYFNFVDVPKAWGDAETPVWSISAASFKSFTSKLTIAH